MDETTLVLAHKSTTEAEFRLSGGGTTLSVTLIPGVEQEFTVPAEDVGPLLIAVDEFNASGAGYTVELSIVTP